MGKILLTIFTKLGGATIVIFDDILKIFTAFFESLFLLFSHTISAAVRVASRIIENIFEFFNIDFNTDDIVQSLYLSLNSIII